jgi:S1-C subfamily serine protease
MRNEFRHLLKQITFAFLVCSAFVAQTPTTPPVPPKPPSPQTELNTVMMQSTMRFQCVTQTGQATIGSGFILGRTIPGSVKLRYVFITAAHVFNDCVGDTGILYVRQIDSQGHWKEAPIILPIRTRGSQDWAKNPTADVAALYVSLPDGAVPLIVPAELLADDARLTEFEVHPGDELYVLGYPLGFQGPGGFPILRSGKIASYPLVPSKDNPYFLMDFRVFQGNSGGPVYSVWYNRFYGGATHIGGVQMVMGLVSEEISATEEQHSIYENRAQRYPLSLAKVVPASLIKETINQLPVPTP